MFFEFAFCPEYPRMDAGRDINPAAPMTTNRTKQHKAKTTTTKKPRKACSLQSLDEDRESLMNLETFRQ